MSAADLQRNTLEQMGYRVREGHGSGGRVVVAERGESRIFAASMAELFRFAIAERKPKKE